MVDLVTHQLNSALRGEVMQVFHFGIAYGGPGRVMRAVDQNKPGLRIDKMLDLVGVNAKAILPAHTIKAGFQAKRLREGGESRESRQRDDYVRAGLSGQPH